MAHISNENDGEKKQFTGKKKIVKPDQNENKKPEGNESEDKKPKEKESPVTGQWMKNLEMLNLKSLDEFWCPNSSLYFNWKSFGLSANFFSLNLCNLLRKNK